MKFKIGIQLTRIHREYPCLLLRPCRCGGKEVGEGVGVGEGDREGQEVGEEGDEESRRMGETAVERVRKRLALVSVKGVKGREEQSDVTEDKEKSEKNYVRVHYLYVSGTSSKGTSSILFHSGSPNTSMLNYRKQNWMRR